MFNSLPFALTFISALTCGLMAGFFFTFSAFVMNGLGRLAATQSIAAMQFHQLDGMESGANSGGPLRPRHRLPLRFVCRTTKQRRDSAVSRTDG
jgi:hypothetical protein